MSFELVIEMRCVVKDLRRYWQDEIKKHGLALEICPKLNDRGWKGFLPIKLERIPDKYLFGLSNVTQVSGFELDFTEGSDSASFRTTMNRTIAELILQCYGAASLAVISNGVYHDLQTGKSYEADDAIARAHQEIMEYEPYIDEHSRVQHPFTGWLDFW